MTYSQAFLPIASMTLLDHAIFASVSAMCVFALFSPLF